MSKVHKAGFTPLLLLQTGQPAKTGRCWLPAASCNPAGDECKSRSMHSSLLAKQALHSRIGPSCMLCRNATSRLHLVLALRLFQPAYQLWLSHPAFQLHWSTAAAAAMTTIILTFLIFWLQGSCPDTGAPQHMVHLTTGEAPDAAARLAPVVATLRERCPTVVSVVRTVAAGGPKQRPRRGKQTSPPVAGGQTEVSHLCPLVHSMKISAGLR